MFQFIKSKLIKYQLEIIFLLIFIVVRVPALGHDNFNTDVWKWKSRIYDFGSGVFTIKFDRTLQKYHPGVTLMWLGSVGVKVYNLYYDVAIGFPPPDNSVTTLLELDFVQKILVVFACGLALSFAFASIRRSLGKEYALIGMYMVALEPFYVGLTRVIHLEGLLTSFMLASAVYIYEATATCKLKLYAISGMFAGLSMLTKSTGLYMFPFLGLWLLLVNWPHIKNALRPMGFWLLSLVFTYFVLWPALWVDPINVFQTLYMGVSEVGVDGGHSQIYFGQFTDDPGLTFYPVVLGFKLSVTAFIGLLGILFVWKKLNDNQKKFIFFLTVFAVFYLIQLSLPTKKLDRYVLPTLVAVSLMSAVFYQFLYENIKFKKALILGTIFLPVSLSLISVHPDYFVYNNPLFGGYSESIKILEPKWLVGKNEIISYIYKLKSSQNIPSFSEKETIDNLLYNPELSNRLTIGFQEKYYTQIWPFVKETGAWAIIEDLTPYAVKTRYFIYPIWDDISKYETRFKLEYVESIYVSGTETWKVYKRV